MSQISWLNKYLIDASAIFDFWLIQNRITRPYHVKVHKFRAIWEHITSLVESGAVLVPQVIADEISFADSELLTWIDSHKNLFVDYDDCIEELKRIVIDYPSYSRKRLNKLNDAILISIAMNKHLTLITSEHIRSIPSVNIPSIPNVCDHFSVQWMNLPEFFVTEGL